MELRLWDQFSNGEARRSLLSHSTVGEKDSVSDSLQTMPGWAVMSSATFWTWCTNLIYNLSTLLKVFLCFERYLRYPGEKALPFYLSSSKPFPLNHWVNWQPQLRYICCVSIQGLHPSKDPAFAVFEGESFGESFKGCVSHCWMGWV